MPGGHPSSGAPLALSRGNSEMVAAAVRTIFVQPDAEHVHSQLDVIAGMLGPLIPAGRDHASRRR
jgi:hypothetical protein